MKTKNKILLGIILILVLGVLSLGVIGGGGGVDTTLIFKYMNDSGVGDGKTLFFRPLKGEPPICKSLDSDDITFSTDSGANCYMDTNLSIKVTSSDSKVRDFRIKFRTQAGDVYSPATEVIADKDVLFNATYDKDIIINEILDKIIAIPRVGGHDVECWDKRKELDVSPSADTGECCDTATQCVSIGDPGDNPCCDSDCGKSPYTNGWGTDGVGSAQDLCSPPNINEWFCDGGSKDVDSIACSVGSSCSVGEHFCQYLSNTSFFDPSTLTYRYLNQS